LLVTSEAAAAWTPPGPERRRGRAGRIAFWAVFAVIGACLIGCVAAIVLTTKTSYMSSRSMQHTFRLNDRIWIQRGPGVRRGDIVVYDIPATGPDAMDPPGAGLYIKRVIGLPGDRVACCDASGDVTVNGKSLHEQAYLYPGDNASTVRFSVTLGPGQMYVMGDHRSISYDSRGYGPVPTADITGRVVADTSGSSTTEVMTPGAFVAAGLAPPDHRPPLLLIIAGIAVILFAVLLVLTALGITTWIVRRGRARRRAAAAYQ
jgi:signal peptidase I